MGGRHVDDAGTGVSRRRFLQRGALVGAAVAPVVVPAAARAAKGEREVWKLYPDYNAAAYCQVDEGRRPGSCHGCTACHHHATHKIFRTAEAADRLRAHRFCKCLVVSGGTLPNGTWTALFGPPHRPHRDVVDKRHRRVQAVLSQRSAA